MKKKLTLLCMTMVLGSTVLYASADGYTTLKNEHLDGIVNSNNLAVTTFTNSFGPDGKVKKDWTRDLYIGLKDELKRMVKIEYRKEPGIYHSEVYHEQTVDHIKLYDKSTEAGEYDLASTNMQSYGMDVTTRDFNGSTIGNASIRSAAITVEVTNRPTVRMGEGEFQVIHYDDNYKRNVVKLSKDGLDNGTNKIINVLPGEADTDAVNVSQLNKLGSQVNINTNDISELKGKLAGTTNILNESKSYTDTKFNEATSYTDQRIAKAGAANAALSGLKYLDYDANHKFVAAASFGQYKGATSGAVGIAYQPNEDVLVHLGTTIGSDHMLNGGVSVRIGDSNKGVKANTKNLAKEMDMIKAENAELKAELAEIKAMLASK
jgi:hemagglutinin